LGRQKRIYIFSWFPFLLAYYGFLCNLLSLFPLYAGTLSSIPRQFLWAMAHKHNRRRVRRSRTQQHAHDISTPRHSLDQFVISQPGTTFDPSVPDFAQSSLIAPSRPPFQSTHTRQRSDIPTKLWQNRHMAWQDRHRAEEEHAAKLEAQQIQLFGGEPGDDVELCYKMLEYFGQLDYIS
jgi:hypothetical protein